MLQHVQLSLDGTDDLPIYSRTEVLAFDPSRSTNGHRVLDLARLGYLPEPVLDPTYGEGGMWTQHRPRRLVACDLDRRRAADACCDYTALPFRDRSFASCLLDPPYKSSGDVSAERGGNHGDLATRFNTTATRRAWEVIEQAMAECARVTRSWLVVKCQEQIDSYYEMQTRQVIDIAERLGWRIAGQLHLVSYVRQPPGTVQRNIRNNYSTFVVLGRRG